MPTITRTIGNFSLESIDHDSWSSRGSKAWTLNLEEIMDGSTITAATLNIYVSVSNSSSSALLWLGSADSSKKISITNARSASYNVLSLFSGKTTFSASDKVTFTYQVNAGNSKGSGTGYFRGYTNNSTLVLTLTYVEPYTACTPPTTLTMAKATSGPSETVRLSWSGAQAGTNNPIASYTVYRSTDNSTWEVLQSGIENEYLDVTAPGTNGSTYYYSVVAVGTVAGYDSAKSTSVSLKCSYTAPTVSNVLLDAGSVTIYKPAGSTAVLSWTGTAGTNNPIAKYAVYRNGTLLQDVTGATSLTVDVPAAGGNYYFNVVAVGAYSNSASVTSPTVYAYSDPSAPSTVALAKSECGKGETVRLSWSGAVAGAQNAITGYRVYRSTSEDGTYSQLGEDIPSTATSWYLDVVSDTRKGRSYYYKVVTIGAHSASAMSSAVSLKTVWTAPTVTSISLSADTVAPGATSELRFAVADGTNNPVTAIEVYQGETKLATLGASATSYTVTAGGEAGDQLSFTVKPIGTVEDGEASSAVVLKSYGPVAAPASVTVSNSTPDAGTNVVLSWAASADGTFNPVQSYQVYRASASGGPFTALGSPVTGTSLSVTAPSVMGNAYYYVVVAKGQFTDSGYSSAVAVTAKVYTVPTAPTVSVSPSVCGIGDSPVLSWSGAGAGTNNPITGYRVFRSTSETGTFTQLGSDLAANVSSLTVDQPPTMGASYYYRVYAIGTKAGFLLSDASNTAQLTRKVYSKCGTPSVSISAELANPGSTVTISWNASADGTNNPVTGYKVFKNSGSGYALYQTVGANVLSVTDTVAASGTTQRYYVQAVSAFEGFSSDNSAVVTVVSNTAPSAVVLTVQPDRYYESGNQHFEWRASADPDGGTIYYDIQYRYAAAVSPTIIWLPWQDIADSPVTDTYLDYDIRLYWSIRRGIPFAFRFRSRDSLGLTSAWTESREFIRNSSPVVPTIVYPTSSPTIYDVQPYIVADIVADPDGHGQYIDMSIDDGAYQQVAFPNTSVGRKVVRCYEALSYGEHTVVIRVRDALGAVSDAASVTLTVVNPAWARDIEPGVIISCSEYAQAFQIHGYAVTENAVADTLRKAVGKIPVERGENPNFGNRPWGPGQGKNKLVYPYAVTEKTVVNGVTFLKPSSYGTIGIRGTATAAAIIDLITPEMNMQLENGKYVLTGKYIDSLSSFINFRYKLRQSDAWKTVRASAATTITITQGKLYALQIGVYAGFSSSSAITVAPMLRPYGTPASFVPYINSWHIYDYNVIRLRRYDANYGNMAIATASFESLIPSGFCAGTVVMEDGQCTLTVTHGYIESYAGEPLPGEWLSSYDYDSNVRTPTIGAEIAYKLAEPLVYEVPVELPTLFEGVNNLNITPGELVATYRRTPISHQSEVEQLYALVNASRAYYDLSAIDVPASVGQDYADAGAGKVGMFAAWGSQMLALYNALKEIYTLIGVSAPTLTITAGMPPTASIINTIRTMIESA